MHRRVEQKHDGKSVIVYPEPLFGSTFTDLENTAKGERRGFYIVHLDNDIVDPHFIEVNVAEVTFKVIDADKKTAKQVEELLSSTIQEMEVENKIVLIKIKGVLSLGRRSDIDFAKFEEQLTKKGALVHFINRSALTSHERAQVRTLGETWEDVEKKILRERMATFKLDPGISDDKVKSIITAKFVGERGEKTAKELLDALKPEKIENGTSNDYNQRIMRDAKSVLGLGDN